MTPKQEEALRDYLQEVIVPLIGDVLVKKLGQAMTFAKEELPKRQWQGLTDEERDAMIGATDLSGTYYYDDLYAVILLVEGKLKEKNT